MSIGGKGSRRTFTNRILAMVDQRAGGEGGGGSGTPNSIAKWLGATTLADSILTDDGVTATVGGALTVSGILTANGNAVFGDAITDTLTFTARAVSDLIPSTTNARNLGEAALLWANVYATSLTGTLATATQNSVTTMTGLTTIGTLVAGSVPASRVTAGAFGAGNYSIAANNLSGTGFAVAKDDSTANSSVTASSVQASSSAASGTAAQVIAAAFTASHTGAGVTSFLIGFSTQISRSAGTVSEGRSINVQAIGTAMNAATGLYVEAITGGAGANNWAIYTNAGLVRFGDAVDIASASGLRVSATKVVGAQGAAVADSTDAGSVILRLNDLLARLRTHGLIAT